MGEIVQGIPGSPGIVIAPLRRFRWPSPEVPHETVSADAIGREVERFREACERARERTLELKSEVERRLGPVQSKIFDPQLLMLEDPDLIEGTRTYIRDSYLTAERAFNLRVLEFRSRWLSAPHARVVDRIADLSDVQARVQTALRGASWSGPDLSDEEAPVIVVAHDLTPSQFVELDPEKVVGLAMDAGTRTSHTTILARSASLPTVVGLGDLTERARDGCMVVLDGHRGRMLLDPSDAELDWFRDLTAHERRARRALVRMAGVEPRTADGTRIHLYANLELPTDAETALAAGVDGIGLFRTEFLVIGQSRVPDEEEQYEAFRGVVETFAPAPVVIRTYDLGGDKFPMFLPDLGEENPFLGWRGVRLYEEMPDLFRNQLRAVLRAAAHGQVRVLLPMIGSLDEVRTARRALEEVARELESRGVDHRMPPLGVMVETPGALEIADILGRHVDFFSLGTNDLVQYVLATDRSNARLARYYDFYHPGVVRMVHRAIQAATRLRLPLTVCGEAAADPLAVGLMIGLGVRALSCAPRVVPDLKSLVRQLDVTEVERLARSALQAETGQEVREGLRSALLEIVEPTVLTATTRLSPDG